MIKHKKGSAEILLMTIMFMPTKASTPPPVFIWPGIVPIYMHTTSLHTSYALAPKACNEFFLNPLTFFWGRKFEGLEMLETILKVLNSSGDSRLSNDRVKI